MSRFETVRNLLPAAPKAWLVTGVAGFIGSNLLEALLRLDQRVVGLDNFATGYRANLEDVRAVIGEERWSRFRFIEGDIRSLETCMGACADIDIVLHQAALGSVPRSIKDPIASHQANVDGFLNMLVAAKEQRVGRFVYASSSAVYGDHPVLPKVEENIGNPLSPYALTKAIGEQYAAIFARTYGMSTIGLRYFNVFGRRQSPNGPYAAVMPRWIEALLKGQDCTIFGDGLTNRDFCFVANAIQANILAGTTDAEAALNQVYNVSFGDQTTLNDLYLMIRDRLAKVHPRLRNVEAVHSDFRAGDIRQSQADISKSRRLLGYEPTHSVAQGLDDALGWYLSQEWATGSSAG